MLIQTASKFVFGNYYWKMSSRFYHITASRLFTEEYGDPNKVVKREDFVIDSSRLKSKEVLVEMMLAPINPADINTIQGTYAVKPGLPFTLGNEGVGKVIGIGGQVEGLKVGDWVIPGGNAWGTWRSHAIDTEEKLQKISNNMNPVMAATLAVNPCTAYRMLHDFATLKKGDVILQNGANSAVGQSVIQISRHLGFRTVNIIRNRESVGELKEELKKMGADFVLTDEEMRTTDIFKKEVEPAKLALNCVGGKGVIDLIKHMGNKAYLVTYGGMSRQPLTVPTAPLIFKDIHLVGYWMTRWNWEHENSPARDEMLSVLAAMSKQGSLQPPKHELVKLSDFQNALSRASDPAGYKGSKLIFMF